MVKNKRFAMYSPKELEGEVDQPFLDSNCDASGTKPEEPVHQETEDRDITNEERPDQTESSEITRGVEEPESVKEGSKETIKPECEVELLEKEMSRLEVEQGSIVKDDSERKDDGVQKDEAICGRGDTASSSEKSTPLTCSEMSPLSPGIQPDVLSSICSSRSSAGEEDDLVFKSMEDSYHRREPGKMFPGNFHTWIQSHLLSSSSRRSTPTPSARLSNEQSPLSSRRQTGPESANWKQRPRTSDMSISDDTVTDVSPLSSLEISLHQLFVLAPSTSSESTLTKDTLGSTSAQQLDANTAGGKKSTVLCAHRKMGRVSTPGNLRRISTSSRSSTSWQCTTCSFTSDAARCVERKKRQHQRELLQSSTRSSSHSGSHSYMPLLRPYHTALNRQRDQRRIQRENVAIRKRLEAVKPTPGMTRIEQLTDYQRQAGYLGIPTPHFRPTSVEKTLPAEAWTVCRTGSCHSKVCRISNNRNGMLLQGVRHGVSPPQVKRPNLLASQPPPQPSIALKKSDRGTLTWIRVGLLGFVNWMDTREVSVFSTIHKAFQRGVKSRDATWSTKPFPCLFPI